MASIIYNSFWNDVVKGNIDCDNDTFKIMLTTSTYTANKDTHTKRSHVTNEVVGIGYSTGGTTITATVEAVDTVGDQQDITFGAVAWDGSTITARYGIIYKSRGGAASADELVMMIDFGDNISSINNTFDITATTLRIQN